MKLNSIFFIAFLHTSVAHAQCVNNITTNPDNPINDQIIIYGKNVKKNTFFDWRQSVFTVNDPLIGVGIYSPFYQSGNIPINHFLYNRDYNPAEGWELLGFDFGINEDGTPKPQVKSTVHLVLYNKYTGILRVFFAADHNGGYNGASVTVYLKGQTVPSLLNEAHSYNALDNFKAVTVSSPAQFQNDKGQWLYADFYMTYDPCTCQNISSIPPKLYIELNLITKSKINFTGKINGTITSIENNQGTVSEDRYSLANLDPTNPKKAYSAFKDMTEFTNKAIAIATSENSAYRNAINQFATELKSVSFIKSGLKTVPFIAPALELFDLFTGGGKDAGPQEVKIMPMAIAADIGLSGTLETTIPFGSVTMATPGTMTSSNYVASEYPYYNEVLGVFGLLSTPTYSSFYRGQRIRLDYGWDYSNVSTGFKIDNQIRYIVNPASGLEVQEIQAQVLIKQVRANKLDSTISTSALVPISSIGNYTLASSNGGVNIIPPPVNFSTTNNRVFIKLFINFKLKNGGSTSQNVLHVVTYPVLTSSPSAFTSWTDQVDNSYKNPEYVNLLAFPQTMGIGASQNITTNTGAKGDITIRPADVAQSRYVRDADGRYYWETYYVPGPPITVTSTNNSQVMAGNSISVLSGASITSGLALRAISGEKNDIVYPQSNDIITSFCSSSSYKVSSRYLRVASDDEGSILSSTVGEKSLSAFPNPTTGNVSFHYHVEEPTQVRLNLISTTGLVVATPVHAYQEAGRYEMSYDASNLPAGIYIYTLETNKGKETKRLVVIK